MTSERSGQHSEPGQPSSPNARSLHSALLEDVDSNLTALDFARKTEQSFWDKTSKLNTRIRSGNPTGNVGVDFAFSEKDMHYLEKSGKSGLTGVVEFAKHYEDLVALMSDKKGQPVGWGSYLRYPGSPDTQDGYHSGIRIYSVAFSVLDSDGPKLELDEDSAYLTMQIESPTWFDSPPQKEKPPMYRHDGDTHLIALSHFDSSDMLLNPDRKLYDRYNSIPDPRMQHLFVSGDQAVEMHSFLSTLSK